MVVGDDEDVDGLLAEDGFDSLGDVFCVGGIGCVSVSTVDEDGVAGWEDDELGVGLTNLEDVDLHGFFVDCGKCAGEECEE